MHVMHETVECMHRLLCIVHTYMHTIDISTNTYEYNALQYRILQYTRIHKLTCMTCQLLTILEMGKVQYEYSICQVISSNMATINVLQYVRSCTCEEEINGVSVYQLLQCLVGLHKYLISKYLNIEPKIRYLDTDISKTIDMSIIIGHARYSICSIFDIRYSMIFRNTQFYKLLSKNEL